MSDKDQNVPIGKSARRNRKGEARQQKSEPPPSVETNHQLSGEPDRPQTPEPDQVEEVPIAAAAAPPEPAAINPTAPADPVPTDNIPISLRTIANAYGDYTLKSLEETRSFVERLTGTRSLDKAMQVQSDFAKRTYATFLAESRRISELHRELARQTLKPLERLVSLGSKTGR